MKREQLGRVKGKTNRTRPGHDHRRSAVPTAKLQPELARAERPDPEAGKGMADIVASGVALNAAVTHVWFTKQEDSALTLGSTIKAVTTFCRRTRDTDLGDVEELLRAQTITLNTLFANLLTRARDSALLDHFDRYIRVALKAQSQCRTTCETLALLKNPPVFAKQANIAHGPQQVNTSEGPQQINNTGAQSGESRARENSEIKQNELLAEGQHERALPEASARLDERTASLTGARDSPLATVATLDRAPDRRR